MGRRKQQQPQANVGRVEERHVQAEEQPAPQDDFDLTVEQLEEWEENNALQARPRKRRKASEQTKLRDAIYPGRKLKQLESEPQQWAFAELELRILGEQRITIATNAAALLYAEDLCLEPSEDGFLVWLLSDKDISARGLIPLPSPLAIASLDAALSSPGSSSFALGPLRPRGAPSEAVYTNQPSSSSSAVPSVLICPLGVSKTAMEKGTAGWAEDPRRGNTPLLELMRCVLRNGSQLDPDNDASILPQYEELARSPLCSARYRDAANRGGTATDSDAMLKSPKSPTAVDPGDGPHVPGSFDAAEIYAAVKPTGKEPELTAALPQLRPTLRGYQRRAAQWMISRERGQGLSNQAGAPSQTLSIHPLWREVPCLPQKNGNNDSISSFYVNIYSGLLSPSRFPAPPAPKGGIASDEMGLGKTVELLALIVGNPYRGPAPVFLPKRPTSPGGLTPGRRPGQGSVPTSPATAAAAVPSAIPQGQKERIDCVCGAYNMDPGAEEGYEGLWVQCNQCLAWQHGACVGFPKRPPKKEYICQPCLRKLAATEVTQPCGTTLVVCPAPILAQWKAEISRHVQPGALKLMVYEGQPQPRPGQPQPELVTAADLAACDIVLTTYDVLRGDLYHEPDPGDVEEEGHALRRRRRRYEIMPTPLTRLRFWRVAIDEAQLVESSTAKAAAMALKLHTEHRWCVTGTPLSRGLEDLQGLMAFLKMEPYATKSWWKKVIQQPYEAGSRAARARLLALLRPAAGGLLWRSAKADVKSELNLPPQHHHLTHLDFSAIERHYYARQHQECVGAARTALSARLLSAAQAAAAALLTGGGPSQDDGPDSTTANRDDAMHQDDDYVMIVEDSGDPASEEGNNGRSGGSGARTLDTSFEDRPLTQREEHKLLVPLFRLRAACVHPQVGAGGIRALSQSRTPMTMSEVLDTLLAKSRVEAEDSQRALVASLNGLAGLLLLQGHVGEAVRAYREVLKVIETNKEYISADRLQQLHTLHNLAEILAGPARGDASIPRTLRDDSFVKEAETLREGYLAEVVARLAAAEGDLKEVRAAAAKSVADFSKNPLIKDKAQAPALVENWWVDAAQLITRHTRDGGIGAANHIRDQLSQLEGNETAEYTLRNAISITNRFRDLNGLHFLVKTELEEMARQRSTAITAFDRLTAAVANPSAHLIHLAGSCGRCRNGSPDVVCQHCKLDEKLTNWEARLFVIRAKAMEAGGEVNIEDAARREYEQGVMRRAGRGGLGEASGAVQDGDGALHLVESGRRSGAEISRTTLVHHPNQTEQALRHLAHQLKILVVPKELEPQKWLLHAAAKVQLFGMESVRKEFIKVRAVASAQLQKLYAMDELEMCHMRIKLRAPGEFVTPIEELYKIHEAEIPVRSTELSAEKAVASAELRRTLGTLRYLQGLKIEEENRAKLASPRKLGGGLAATAAGCGDAKEESMADEMIDPGSVPAVPAADPCPICQEPLARELCMLPCGHRLCCRCQLALAEQIPANQPAASKRLGCPTCRTRVHLSEIAYIDTGKEEEEVLQGGGTAEDYSSIPGEKSIRVKGSYGTKLEAVVRRLVAITQADPSARVLVFSSWKDALELVAHALTANGILHLYPRTGKKFDAALAQFRADFERQTTAEAEAAGYGAGSSTMVVPETAPAVPAVPPTPRILLLLMKQGGNGLNLQQAQHVVFIEPLLDPAEEAQAVGRVDRIGQTKATHVHRFVIQQSIEENVHRLGQLRAAAMDLSAAAVKRGKSAGERGALTLRDVAALLREDTVALMGPRETSREHGGDAS